MKQKGIQGNNGFAVELFFDPTSEERILAFRKSLYDQGINPVLGETNDRPHISLAVFTNIIPSALAGIIERVATQFNPFTIQLSALGVFPRQKNIFFLTPVPSLDLLHIHAKVHGHLSKKTGLSMDYYTPGNWVPHCTLETALSDSQLRKAIFLGKKIFSPITGYLTQIGLVSFQPVEYLVTYPLNRKE